MTHTAEYRTHDGRTGTVTFETDAKKRGWIVRAAKNAIFYESIFSLGETVLEREIAILIVDGNAA